MMDIRNRVRETYGQLAANLGEPYHPTQAGPKITDVSRNYEAADLSGLPPEVVAASLGCANPLVFAQLKAGETVLDLGSGAGVDALVASKHVGAHGKVYGLDMTDEMLQRATANKEAMGADNVEFLKGYIEDVPLTDASVDVVVSNCVINLSEHKGAALAEAYRVIKPGGRLRIADVVSLRTIDQRYRQIAEMWYGCLAGAITIPEYQDLLRHSGFTNITIEIVHVYTRDIIMSEYSGAAQADLLGPDVAALDEAAIQALLDAVDGAFAGALISGDKPA